jgi:hypothetical protein
LMAKPMSQEKTEKELQEIFEREGCPRRGRRFDPSILRPEQGLRTMLERHKRAAEIWLQYVRTQHVPTMGPVHFDYIENGDVNAFASEWDNYDFVGVYVGAIVTIYSFFGSLLAYPRFLMSIGNPLAEEEWKSETFDPKQLYRQPKDVARRSFAHLLATIAIDFLFAHEIGHLMNGHVKLLKTRKEMPLLAEFDPTQKTPEENLTRQTLEMDADSFAVGQGLATAFGRAGDASHVFPPDWRQWYGTPTQALFSWTLAIYGFFRLFFKGTVNLDHLDSTTHPPPNIRLSMVLTTVVEFLKKTGREELIPQLQPIIGEVMRTVETGQALITSTSLNLGGVQQTLDPRANKHMGRLLDHWKILRPGLVPLNRGGRLAD